ncbi:MAG: M55 family metallopeptidase [Deltaproteobacteria bacterium]|nr:M55 family metallopeptidase [Deltaproteobacteria bacterium]MBW1962065.1 M55 family metallopeptidase [Deltaproteobacteria bacterium]MBW1994686.1 M55 family metallopeptidase [Deltaproteobacteria bacterium]MBW2153707.1 M55 family metallopeptidase [Deltaproteobacteria bacterium]
MKVFISADMEGISGIVDASETNREHSEYKRGRALMVADVNAAIEGVLAFDKTTEIVVADGHGSMTNIEPEALNDPAVLVRGTPKPLSQMSGIDSSFDAAIFIGYHSMRGTLHGILSHTFSGKAIERLKINEMEVGETAMNAGIAGYYHVPLIFVSGDLAVTREAKALNPEIEAIAVKEAISRTAAKCLHPSKARQMITNGVVNALKKRNSIQPFAFKPPVEFNVRYVSEQMADAVEFMPSAERIDAKTIRFVQDDYLKAYGAFRASIFIALSVDR